MAHTATHVTTRTIPTVKLPAGVIPTPQAGTSQDTLKKMKESVVSPTLPVGAKLVPQTQVAQPTAEDIATPGVATTAPTAAVPTAAATQAAAAQVAAAQVVTDPAAMTAAQYAATTMGAAPTMAAAQGAVTAPMTAQQGAIVSDATVAGQLEGLQQQVQSAVTAGTDLPAWALGAQKLVEANMAKRGMGASSMYAEALAQGVMQSAVPIAAADAQTYKEMIFQNLNNRQQASITNAAAYLQMDMANLSNNQQESLQNLAARQAQLFTDQSAQNAAAQFNATSQGQVDQFFNSLQKQVQTSNAQRSDSMNQFANAETNKISAINANNTSQIAQSNAEREAAINQFNSTLSDARERFNVENQRVIDQSNTTWRRQINTANTAAANAALQSNAQNLLNISNYALSALWQEWRDEATWSNEAAQNDLDRGHNMGMAAFERATEIDLADQASRDNLYNIIGRFLSGL
jgi:hypothetical protein